MTRHPARPVDSSSVDVVVVLDGTLHRKDGLAVDYITRLRRLTFNEPDVEAATDQDEPVLDPRTLALVRLGALVAVGGAVPSYGAQADAALDAGASTAEVVDVLFGVLPVVGRPRVVAAAPQLAMALGYDADTLEQTSDEPC